MTSTRTLNLPASALPLLFFAAVAAIPFATFGASPKTRPIMTAPDVQIVAGIGNISGETR